jgi:sugar phosphate isomerase/epimerase
MDLALSTHLFVNHRLNVVWLEKIWNAGIPLVEIFCARQHLDYRDKPQIRELGHWFRDSRLKLHSLHAPMYTDDCWGRTGPDAVLNLTEPIKWKRIAMVDEIKRAIEISEDIPFKYLIQHLGVSGDEFDDFKLDYAFTCLEELKLFAGARGVSILLENTPNKLSSAERLLHFLEVTHLKLDFCFDTGHAHLMEGLEPAFALMKSRIRSTHIHDNDGTSDLHLFPLTSAGGTIEWNSAMPLLASGGDQWPLVLELREPTDVPNVMDAVKQTFARLLEAAEPPSPEDLERSKKKRK